jgi:hypothetical protein
MPQAPDARPALHRTFSRHPIPALLLTYASVFTALSIAQEIGSWFGSGPQDASSIDLFAYSAGWAVGVFAGVRWLLPRWVRS